MLGVKHRSADCVETVVERAYAGKLSGLAFLEIRERETGVFEDFDEKTGWQIARMDGYGSSIAGPGILQ